MHLQKEESSWFVLWIWACEAQ